MASDRHAIWSKRVARWQDSGLSAKEFAAKLGVNQKTLTYWRWRLRSERQARHVRVGEPEVRFVEVVAPDPVGLPGSASRPVEATAAVLPQVDPLEVVLGDGLRIRVPVSFDAEVLRRLVFALEGR